MHMVPAIRNILGGFLFSGDDVYKQVRVLSGGERTRLAVARMLLRPSNTLLLDEPTNHLDLDSKDVLLDALVDYGGTLIFVSHDRYFVERLATKIIEVGHGEARRLSRHLRGVPVAQGARRQAPAGRPNRRESAEPRARREAAAAAPEHSARPPGPPAESRPAGPPPSRAAADRETRKRKRADSGSATARARRSGAAPRASPSSKRASPSASRPSRRIEAAMAAPGFYDDRDGGAAGHRPASGADVGGRRSDAPVGSAPVTSSATPTTSS